MDVFSVEAGIFEAQKRFTDNSVNAKVYFLNSAQLFYTSIPSYNDGICQGIVETASIYDLTSKSQSSLFQIPRVARYENSLPTCYASRSNSITHLDSNSSRNINFYQYVNGVNLNYFIRELLLVPGSNQLAAMLEDSSRSGEDGDFSVQLNTADLSGQGRPHVQGMRYIKNLSLSSQLKRK